MGQMWGEEVEGRGAQEPGEGGLEKRVGAVSLTAPIKIMTQRHRIPVSTPSPHPYPHRANMALQRGAQSSVELLQWLAWGLGLLLLALAETQASDTPIPAQVSEVLVVGGEAHHPRL